MLARSLLFIVTLAIVGCALDPVPPAPPDMTLGHHVHMMPLRDSGGHVLVDGASPAPVAPGGAHLSYNGGKVIQNVHISQVLYGSGTYLPELTSMAGLNMASSYTQMVTSGVFDWLAEYNTTVPAQSIGRGTYGGSFQITPATSRNGSTIDDESIQAEIAAQISAGVLAVPDDHQIYMVHFPSGKTITQGGSSSCVAGGFCAYHGTFKIGLQNVYYGVLPALAGGCATGCGRGTAFQNQQSVSSHELIEAVTDAEVGLATVIGPPLAWYDPNNGEIGDICNAQHGTFTGTDGNTYTIQQEFSNQQNDCITTRSTAPDFAIAINPAGAILAPGAATSFAVTATAFNGSSQSIALAVSGLPSGVTGAFTPTEIAAGGTATLTLTASSTGAGAATFTVTGTSGAATHSATAALTVVGGGGVLGNSVPVTGLSGARSQQTVFTIEVPADQALLTVSLRGGSGDADLYVRAGAAPTLATFDCISESGLNNETCTVNGPAGTTYFVMVYGFAAYNGATLVATYAPTTTLSNGVSVTGLSGDLTQQRRFAIAVPAGQPVLRVQLSGDGATGDADIYVRAGASPTQTINDCSSENGGNNERCTFYHPAAGTYFVLVATRVGYAGPATLVATYGVDTTSALSNGVPVTGLSGLAGWPTEFQFFKLSVPAGVPRVVFQTTGVGDADLFVKFGAEPSQNTFDCRSSSSGSNESCIFTSPAAGDYSVMVRSAFSYSGLTLVGHFP